MLEPADHPDEPEWVRQLRAEGRTVRRGKGDPTIPLGPGIGFTLPDEPDTEQPGLLRRLLNLFNPRQRRRGSHAIVP